MRWQAGPTCCPLTSRVERDAPVPAMAQEALDRWIALEPGNGYPRLLRLTLRDDDTPQGQLPEDLAALTAELNGIAGAPEFDNHFAGISGAMVKALQKSGHRLAHAQAVLAAIGEFAEEDMLLMGWSCARVLSRPPREIVEDRGKELLALGQAIESVGRRAWGHGRIVEGDCHTAGLVFVLAGLRTQGLCHQASGRDAEAAKARAEHRAFRDLSSEVAEEGPGLVRLLLIPVPTVQQAAYELMYEGALRAPSPRLSH